MEAMRLAQRWRCHGFCPRGYGGLETPAMIVYIMLKFLVGMTKSGSTRSRSFLLPADSFEATTGIE
ncbi:hypothetical protein ACFSOZ_37955 [Mesorhizobium newzealandense]|uniref:Transposase DDE domain-containing protein n=1 Tax=Mesorhizobium newzealandense TaxID=1300302 RepID=A0ABW4UPN0_9HYPH